MSSKSQYTPDVRDDQSGGATDQVGEGTRDIAGAEASELSDHGRGGPETNIGKEMGRKLPQETGGIVGATDAGLAAEVGVSKARDHGSRGKN